MSIAILVSLLSFVFLTTIEGAESQSPQYTAQELAQKTEDFWNGIKTIDLTYRFTAPFFDTNRDKVYRSVETDRWIVDFQTNRRAGRLNSLEGIDDVIPIYMWYYDGDKTYFTEGADVDSVVRSTLEGIEKNNKYRRAGTIILNLTEQDARWENNSYRCWYKNNKFTLFKFSLDYSEEDNTFAEFVKKYPSSSPVRSIAENGDVLWTFYVFPNQEAKDAFPEIKVNGICFEEVTVNESKNFLVQEIKATIHYVPKEGEPIDHVSFFKVTDYINVSDMWFPKRSIYGEDVNEPDAFENQIHEVVDLKVNENNIDFSPFKIPAFTPRVDIDEPGNQIAKFALWGDEDKPIKEFTSFDEYLQFISTQNLEIQKQKHEELKRQKAENLTTRIALCTLGLALVATAIWLKRRSRKTKFNAEAEA